ncbi:class I SAM-dependent methyltransferase [Rhodococcus sp. UNC363MFTsu5.1]|uniref:class I SAM-dependent methyltransferase n=1 Tax=Rhodococcus sp. UNC363MFTsu5.1 TaxID=1449069 RepID=UPI0004821C51|nr:class I SAM-dependent methyltransferase [Rhodococcus sp. UNC363MFTsu5.1]
MSTTQPVATADALAQRIVEAALGTVDLLSIHMGDRLGWYRSLRVDGPATPEELAVRTDTHPRYAREWLEQQAVTGLIEVDSDEPRRFTLPSASAEVLTDGSSLAYLAPLARMLCAAAEQMPALLEAYRSGGGVGWAQYGADARESQAEMNRPWYERALPEALRSVPDLDALLREPDTRIADLGCGGGWSTIALARAYPAATVDGFDIDAASVRLASSTGQAHPDTAPRVAFHCGDAARLPAATFRCVFAFECVHDMPNPVEVLAAARRSLIPGGRVVIMDEAVAGSFEAPGDEIERLMYGFSLLICLPDGMSHRPTAATGTVMRPDTLRGYAHEAGFTGFEILPIDGFGFWRFYQLTA